jgi:hypothetical protein
MKKDTKTVLKKINRRNQTKYPGLKPQYNLKVRQEEIEDIASYVGKLNSKEKEWLNSFVEEEINANFNHSGRKINKTKTAKREIYNRNNARNRDIFSRAKAQGKLTSMNDMTDGDNGGEDKD